MTSDSFQRKWVNKKYIKELSTLELKNQVIKSWLSKVNFLLRSFNEKDSVEWKIWTLGSWYTSIYLREIEVTFENALIGQSGVQMS